MQIKTNATLTNFYLSNVLLVKCVCASFFTINHTCPFILYQMRLTSWWLCIFFPVGIWFGGNIGLGCFLMYNLIWNANKKLSILLRAPHSQRTFAWTRKDRRAVIWDREREMTTATHSSIYQSPCIPVRNWAIGAFLRMSQSWQDTLY